MDYRDEIFTTAHTYAGQMSQEEQDALLVLCEAAENELKSRLKPNITPEDCLSSFIIAAALLALADLSSAMSYNGGAESFTAGNVSVSMSSNKACECLRNQAEIMMAPYIKGRGFSFLGVRG